MPLSTPLPPAPRTARRRDPLAALCAAALSSCACAALPAAAQDGMADERRVASVQVPAAAAGPADAATAPAVAPPPPRIDIGHATERLLSLQASPQHTPAPRPIAGEQARRSYARYLKSFETDIPALYKTGSDSGGRN